MLKEDSAKSYKICATNHINLIQLSFDLFAAIRIRSNQFFGFCSLYLSPVLPSSCSQFWNWEWSIEKIFAINVSALFSWRVEVSCEIRIECFMETYFVRFFAELLGFKAILLFSLRLFYNLLTIPFVFSKLEIRDNIFISWGYFA